MIVRSFLRCFFATLLIVIITVNAQAEPNGITGRTGTNGTGCGGNACHGGKSTATTVSLLQAVDGKITVAKGSTIQLTLRVANATKAAGGCDIAVKTSKNGLVRAGTLKAVDGSGLYSSGGELTHVTPRAFVDGSAEFLFTWQAPATVGTYYLQAAGNAVNANGSSSGDNWNFMEPVQIVVSEPSSVNETISPLTSVFPVPAHNHVTVSAPVEPGTEVEVAITDAIGEIIYSWTGISNTEEMQFVWDGRTNNGTLAPTGTYSVAIINQRRIMIGKAVIIH